MEKNQSQQGTEDLETIAEAADLLSVPEGAREYIDLIGDEDFDSFNNPNIQQQ
jgi:hypothetical protein